MTISPEEFDATMRARGWVRMPSGWVPPSKILGAGGGHPETGLACGNSHTLPGKGHKTEGPTVPTARTPKRLRQSSKPLLNKLETEWYHVLKSTYPADCPVFSQAVRFRLGNGIWYKPDFIVWGAHVYGYEVKGKHAFRGGFENLKVAASIYKQIKWYLVWKENGQWQEQEILP